jgi:hypothetical protein
MINKTLAKIAICALGIAFAGNAAATFHLYKINELFSNADGSIQFIELAEGPDLDGQNLLGGNSISVSQVGATTHSFMFTKDLPSIITHNTSVLIATQGFADLGIVTPDFIVPAGFLFTNGGTVNYAGVNFMTYASLPTDGVLSLNRDLTTLVVTTGVNSPKDFAGVTGTVPAPVALNFVPAWNLVGNGLSGTLNVAATFGDTTKVNTLYKWVPSKLNWAFYTPTLSDGGAAYAASKGFDFLTSINPGEGFWLNAIIAFSAQLPNGTALSSSSFQTLPSGWSLIAVGDNKSPSQFNALVGATTPLTTLWAWNAAQMNWYFYAPSLEAQGGTALADYIAAKSYLGFGTKILDPSTGFWVNKP